MKRIICILLSVLFIAVVLSGCSGGDGAEADTSAADTANTADTAESESSERTINGVLKSFSAKTLDGGSFSPEDFAKYDITVINFWGTYCGPCVSEMPDLAAFNEALPENVSFVTFCIDAEGNEDGAQSIIDEAGLTAPVITNADGDFTDVLSQIQYIPTTLFINKDGKIVGSEIIGGVDSVETVYNEHIEAALAEADGE